MDGGSSEGSEARFAAYVEALGVVLGHADRQQPMHDYCLGLLMPIDRKSVEPMAAVTAPGQVAAKHQSLLHFVGNAPWSDAAMLGKSLPSRKRGWQSWCCRRSSAAGQSRPGSSTTRAFPRRGGTRSG
jgi:SRSO17 transposase